MKKITGFAILLLGLCQPACAGRDTPGLTYDDGKREPVIWLLQELNGQKIAGDKQPRLSIHGGKVSASSGCNSGTGDINIADSSIRISGLTRTEKPCMPAALYKQEEAYFGALNSAERYEMNAGRLMLSGKDSKLLFIRRVKPAAKPLAGTVWNISAIGGAPMGMKDYPQAGGVVRSLFRDTKITIVISGDTLKGDFGCGTFQSRIRINADRMTVTQIEKKIAGCSDREHRLQAAEFMEKALLVVRYKIDENHLQMFDSENALLFDSIAE